MGHSYYIFKSGTLSREQNTVYFENAEGKRPIPVEDIDALYLFGEVTLNSKFLDFLDKNGICAHFFDYQAFDSAGVLQISQASDGRGASRMRGSGCGSDEVDSFRVILLY